MSVESFKQFFQAFLNDPAQVNDFTQNVNSTESGIQFAIDRGAQKGYQFSRQDVEEGLASLKSEWLAAKQSSADNTEPSTRAGGWDEGEAGAAIGDAINTYIDDEGGDSGGW